MYFDCEGAWSTCKSNAMWQVKWKARLRRVQPLSRMAGEGLAQVLAVQISSVLNTVANEFLGKVPTLKDNPKLKEEMGKKKGELQKWLYENNPTSRPGANAREIH
jgi:hypothetical protein